MPQGGSASPALDLQRHRRALQLCDEASDLPAIERLALIRTAAGDDADLFALASNLLERLPDDDEPPPIHHSGDAARRDLGAGVSIGGYRIERLLGEGGMGTVYLAQRNDAGVTRLVALKTMNRLRPQELELARFKAEQQALAQLHHPYIASLLDVGVAEDGTPYFAMEYVPGSDITKHCDQHNLTLVQRIALWAKVCEAVQYAHRNLIVHRDIKPANILVTEDGLPKLLDFGVAKLLGSGSAELTQQFLRHLTLDYSTPERIVRGSVSTAEDVYALGVLLYELLCGERPFARAELTFGQLMQEVEQEHAPPMQVRFAAQSAGECVRIATARRASVRQLRSELQDDIAAVLAQALHPDPARRFGSVDALAEDVRRCGAGLPVKARGDGARYRVLRFAGRHRLGVAAVAVSVSAVVLALAVSVCRRRAWHRRRRTAPRQLAGFCRKCLRRRVRVGTRSGVAIQR